MLLRPRLPSATVVLLERAEDRELAEARAGRPEVIELGRAAEAPPERVQRRHLQREDTIAIDVTLAVQRAPRLRERGEVGAALGGAGHVVDPEIERIAEAPAARRVRARLLRHGGRDGWERIEQDQARAKGTRPARETAEVSEIADAPALARACRVELRGPSPDPKAIRQMTARRDHDDARRPAVVPKIVIAEREIRGKRPVDVEDSAVLERQRAARHGRTGFAGTQHAHGRRRRRRRVRLGAHRGDDRTACVRRGVAPDSEGVVVAVVDRPRVGTRAARFGHPSSGYQPAESRSAARAQDVRGAGRPARRSPRRASHAARHSLRTA